MGEARYGTSDGVDLTGELVARLAAEAEAGYDVTQLRPRRGRPPIGDEAAQPFQVRLEPELREALTATAEREHTSPSEIVRRALRTYFKQAS